MFAKRLSLLGVNMHDLYRECLKETKNPIERDSENDSEW